MSTNPYKAPTADLEVAEPAGVPLALVFLWFFYRGVVGTFQFHRWKRSAGLPG